LEIVIQKNEANTLNRENIPFDRGEQFWAINDIAG